MTGRGTTRIVLPGAAMIAVSFGLARYGYGLLLPDMQHELGLDARQSGLIASGAYLSYLVANLGVVWLTTRFGPRLPLAAAGAAAASGMALISLADGPLGLAVGVLVAGASAGLAFPPYADLVASRVTRTRRAISWSAISSGTGWGVALAGPLAVTFGTRWRLVWLVFAALAVIVALAAVLSAPAGRGSGGERPPRLRLSWVFCPRSGPLLVSATLIGLGSSVWWAFSVDALRAAGVAATPARVVYAVCGVAGVVASATGVLTARIGLRRSYQVSALVLVAAIALCGLAAGNVAAAAVAATLFGTSYNGAIAGQGLWSADVFASRPSAGLAAVNTALTVGTIAGPALAGGLIRGLGYAPALLAAAAVVALGARLAPPRAA